MISSQWLKKVCNIVSFALKLIMCFDEFLLSFKIRLKNARRRRERKVNISFCYVIYIYQGADGKKKSAIFFEDTAVPGNGANHV